MHVLRPLPRDLVRSALLAAALAVVVSLVVLGLTAGVLGDGSAVPATGPRADAGRTLAAPTPAIAPDWVRDPLALPALAR